MLRELLMRGLHFLDQTTAEIRSRFSFRPLEAKQRRKVQGQWFKNGVEIAGRAAHCRDLYDRYISDVPYTGDQIREKATRVTSAKEVWVQLDLLARQARDTYLIERSELHVMSMGVLKALETRAAYPFLPEGDRQNMQPGIAMLRTELDQKNRRISKTKKAAKKAGAGPELAAAVPAEGAVPVAPALPPPRGAWAPERRSMPQGRSSRQGGQGRRAGSPGRDRLVGRRREGRAAERSSA